MTTSRIRGGVREGRIRPAFVVSALCVAIAAGCGDKPLEEPVLVPAPASFAAFAPEAVPLLEAAIGRCRASPTDRAAFAALGRAYHAFGAPMLALAAYARAEFLGDRDPKLRHLRGLILASDGRASEAAAAFAAASAIDPQALWPVRERARALLDCGDFAAAASAADRAAQLGADDSAVFVILARTRRENGDLPGALAAVETALRLRPGDPHAEEYRRVLRRASGLPVASTSAAPAVVRNEIVRDPWFGEVQRLGAKVAGALPRVEALLAAGRVDAALNAVREAEAAGQGGAELSRKAGEAYVRKNDLKSAAAEYDRALAFDPSAPRLRTMLASIRLDQGDASLAAREARIALEVDADDADATFLLGAALAATGDHASAESHLVQAAARLSDRALVWILLGRTKLALRKNGEARQAFERAAAIDPRNEDAKRGLAVVGALR